MISMITYLQQIFFHTGIRLYWSMTFHVILGVSGPMPAILSVVAMMAKYTTEDSMVAMMAIMT
jgi:hypothetical protein